MRGECSIRIGLQRRKRQDQAAEGDIADAFDGAEEEAHVGHRGVDAGIARHHDQHDAVGRLVCGSRHGQGLGLRGEAGQRLSSESE